MPKSCSVDGCSNHNQKVPTLSFYCFPKCELRRRLWMKALKKVNKDGTPWKPAKHSVICSAHFIYGKPSTDPLHPDYVPSIFPDRPHTKDDRSTNQSIQLIMQDVKNTGKANSAPVAPVSVPPVFFCNRDDNLSSPTQLAMEDADKNAQKDIYIDNPELPEHIQPWRDGRRLVDLDVLTSNLENCHTCRKGPLSLAYMYIKGEERDGLGGYLTVMCPSFSCNAINRVPYSKVGGQIDSKGASVSSFEVNTKLTPAKIKSLGGLATVNAVLEALNLEPLDQSAVESPDGLAGLTSDFVTADPPCETDCDIIIKKEVEDDGYNEVLVHRSEETQQEEELEQGAANSLLDEIAEQEEMNLPPPSPPRSPKMHGGYKGPVGAHCCVPKCHNSSGKCKREGKKMSFYSIPKNPEEQKIWLERMGRTEVNEDGEEVPITPKNHWRVCSAHFVGGARSNNRESFSYYPTIFPNKVFNFVEGAQAQTPSESTEKRPLQDAPDKAGRPKKQRTLNVPTLDVSHHEKPSIDHEYIKPGVQQRTRENPKSQPRVQSVTLTTEELKKATHVRLDDIKHSDEKMQFYTNLPNYSVFKALCDHIKSRTKTSGAYNWRENFSSFTSKSAQNVGPDRKLAIEEEIFIVLVKLKTGTSNQELAKTFDTSSERISCLICTWINLLCSELKALFEAESGRQVLSENVEYFKNLKLVIDCTEVWVQRVTTYTPKDTVKLIVSLSPNLAVSLVSKAPNDCASNHKQNTDGSEDGETIAADLGLKGFKVVKCFKKRGVQILIPESRDKPQKREQIAACLQYISKAKTHVKEIIDRIKTFYYLERVIRLNMQDSVEQIFTVCAYLTNLSFSSLKK